MVNEEEVVEAVLKFLPGTRVWQGGAESSGWRHRISTLRLTLRSASLLGAGMVGISPVAPAADGTFAFTGVPPGKYWIGLTGGDPWVLRSAIIAGGDVLGTPLSVEPGRDVSRIAIALTDRPTEIAGTLFDALHRPAPECAILMFSTDRAYWTTAPRRVSGVVKVGTGGRFIVKGLPPGEYFITALTDLDPAQASDPAALQYLADFSLKVTLGEGQRKVPDLKLPG